MRSHKISTNVTPWYFLTFYLTRNKGISCLKLLYQHKSVLSHTLDFYDSSGNTGNAIGTMYFEHNW
jgi:hypothetical protein